MTFEHFWVAFVLVQRLLLNIANGGTRYVIILLPMCTLAVEGFILFQYVLFVKIFFFYNRLQVEDHRSEYSEAAIVSPETRATKCKCRCVLLVKSFILFLCVLFEKLIVLELDRIPLVRKFGDHYGLVTNADQKIF